MVGTDDVSSYGKIIEEIGQAISPIISPMVQQEEIAINKNVIIRDMTKLFDDVSMGYLQTALDKSKKFSDILRNLIVPDLYVDRFESIAALDSWLSSCSSREEIEAKIDFREYAAVPLQDLGKRLSEKGPFGYASMFDEIAGFIEKVEKQFIRSINNAREQIDFLAKFHKLKISKNSLRDIDKLVDVLFEEGEISEEYLPREIPFRLMRDFVCSVLTETEALKSYIIINHQIRKIKAEKGELYKEILEEINADYFHPDFMDSETTAAFRKMAGDVPTFFKYWVLGIVDELENSFNYELLRRDKLSLNIDIFPDVFVRECVIHHLTMKKYAEQLRRFWHHVRNKSTREEEFQNFLFRHPRFLLGNKYTYLYEKLQLADERGKILIPDFTLVRPDRSIDILELKRANLNRFIVGRPRRERFSQQVADAVQQCREYKRWFQDERNKHWFEDVYGTLRLKVIQPQVTLVVGREDELRDSAVYERLKREIRDIQIKTYTQLYEEADLIYQQMKTI